MSLPLCQPIRARTKTKKVLDILVIEEDRDQYSIIMTGCCFPCGTTFPTAKAAVQAAVQALNRVFIDDEHVTSLHTHETPELLSESELNSECL